MLPVPALRFDAAGQITGFNRALRALCAMSDDSVPTDLADRMKALERENREPRQAHEILRKASAYFAMAEFDRRSK